MLRPSAAAGKITFRATYRSFSALGKWKTLSSLQPRSAFYHVARVGFRDPCPSPLQLEYNIPDERDIAIGKAMEAQERTTM
ncbi:hypothetical protein ZHAS_00003848 [Anopheles sinensis]|uniref:Uncharacterized protein n=1 Tax=Anopheles sinensis TaxID=74873 RepID=A0A084VFF5_ANOSI|nr:hypothetical protein ZHAS_00003848 [Anopheles sinensis]